MRNVAARPLTAANRLRPRAHLQAAIVHAHRRYFIITRPESLHLFYRPVLVLFSNQKRRALKGEAYRLSWLGHRTCDQAVVGSIPGRAAIKLPIGQLSLPSLRGR